MPSLFIEFLFILGTHRLLAILKFPVTTFKLVRVSRFRTQSVASRLKLPLMITIEPSASYEHIKYIRHIQFIIYTSATLSIIGHGGGHKR